MLQANPALDAPTVKPILQRTARTDSFTGAAPNTTWGYGKVDALAALDAVTSTTLFVPVALSSSGANGSFYTTELALTNRGTTDATITYAYTAAFGGSSGTATETLGAGRQKTYADTITSLRALGIPLGDSGNRGGTLQVTFGGLSSPRRGRGDRPHGDARRRRARRPRVRRPAVRAPPVLARLALRPQAERDGPFERRNPACGRPVGRQRHAETDGRLGRPGEPGVARAAGRHADAGRVQPDLRDSRVERVELLQRLREGGARLGRRALQCVRRHQRPGELRRVVRRARAREPRRRDRRRDAARRRRDERVLDRARPDELLRGLPDTPVHVRRRASAGRA